jgi:hypothetical protein
MKTIPAKKARRLHLFACEILPTLNKTYPIIRLNNAHKILTNGDDNPLPGGFANGVGKLSPDIPFTKCGTTLVKKRPAAKHAI